MGRKKLPFLKKQNKSIEYDYIDEQGCSWDSPESWFWSGVLGGCGCGSSDYLAERAIRLLKNFSLRGDDWDKRFSIYDRIGDEILAHWFNDKELTEHGTSIYGSWLTKKGERVLGVLNELIEDE